MGTEPIAIVGLLGGQWFGRAAEDALRGADVLIGNARQFSALPAGVGGERVELWGDLGAVVDFAVAQRAAGRRPCILADGDPGYHGMVRYAAGRLGDGELAVHPTPSSIALAWARVGTNWDDAVVASAYAQSTEEVVATVAAHGKVAVLVSRRLPPAALGAALLAAGCGDRAVTVCAHLAEPDEQVTHTDVAGLAAGGVRPPRRGGRPPTRRPAARRAALAWAGCAPPVVDPARCCSTPPPWPRSSSRPCWPGRRCSSGPPPPPRPTPRSSARRPRPTG